MTNATATLPHSYNADHRWECVASRVTSEDDAFVYAVKSTGIFCLPSCASRRPLRSNVLFFDRPQDAIQSGFRACKKCNPMGNTPVRSEVAIERACKILAESEQKVTLQTLAAHVGMSSYHFHRLFKNTTGLTPRAYRQKAWDTPKGNDRRMGDEIPRNSEKSKHFATPAMVRYLAIETELGFLAVAATEQGVCSVELGNTKDELVARILRRFEGSVPGDDAPTLRRWTDTVAKSLESPVQSLDIPLDILGTEFQQKVWTTLRAIPIGSTWTYTQLAETIGQPRAVRAVANACASNPVAIIIPCHRIIRSDGSLGGFRWGLHRKQALLDLECRQ